MSKAKYLVYTRSNELSKIGSVPLQFGSIDDAKKYCESIYTTLGDAKFYDDSIDDKVSIIFTREYSASDYLARIEVQS